MTDIPSLQTVLPLGLSLALGLLIGLERGWHGRAAAEGTRVAGVRTFGLIGLVGGFAGLLASSSDLAIVGYGFVGIAILLGAGYVARTRDGRDIGVTTLVTGLLTYAFGAGATQGYMLESAMAAVVTALLLGYKSALHGWVSALEKEELRATLKLLMISVVVLPVLPNVGYGPWQALNPFEVWWMVVLVAAVSFVGYFAMKIAGTGNGALVTGLLAGLASSTALTLHFSRLAHKRPAARPALAAGVLVACGTMFPRMLLVAWVVHGPMFQALLIPALAMAATVYLAAALMWWLASQAEDDHDGAKLKNPLELGSALVFGGLLAVIMLAGKGLEAGFGEAGIIVLAGIAGISDVDAITLTLAKMSRDDIAVAFAAFAIVLAGAVNSTVKGAMAFVIGSPGFGLRAALPLVLAAAVGPVLAWVLGDLGTLLLASP